MPTPGEARHVGQIIAAFVQKPGFTEGFNYQSAADIFREHAALSGFGNNNERAFDISALENISDALVNAITAPLCGQPEFKHTCSGERLSTGFVQSVMQVALTINNKKTLKLENSWLEDRIDQMVNSADRFALLGVPREMALSTKTG